MKKITEEMLGLSGFRFDGYDGWNAHTNAGSRLCFKNPNPLGNFHNLISWEVRSKIYSEINKIVLDKTNNKNIAENYKPIIQH